MFKPKKFYKKKKKFQKKYFKKKYYKNINVPKKKKNFFFGKKLKKIKNIYKNFSKSIFLFKNYSESRVFSLLILGKYICMSF